MPNPTSKLNLVINGTSTQLDIHDANAVDLSSNQTVGGNKEFTGTTTAHDLVPSATDTYNFGSSSYQWNNAYIKSLTINGVACGDILTHNASEFVDLSSNQTIGGNKEFNNVSASDSLKAKKYINFNDNTNIYISGGRGWNLGGQINLLGKDNVTRDDSGNIVTDGGDVVLRCPSNLCGIFDVVLNVNNSIKEPQFSPTHNKINLGTSTHKWKTINGLNPGALSLPSSNAVNILSELQSDGYIAPSNGYVRAIKDVRTACASTIGIRNETTGIEDRRIAERTFILGVMVPVQAGEKIVISDDWNSVDGVTVFYSAYFHPCQGNI